MGKTTVTVCSQAADDSHRSLHLQSRRIKCISTDVTFRKMKQKTYKQENQRLHVLWLNCFTLSCTGLVDTHDMLTRMNATLSRFFCFLLFSLEDLELPGVLVLVVQAVHCGEAQFPGLLVLVVQAVNRGEAQGGGSAVALWGQRGRGLA